MRIFLSLSLLGLAAAFRFAAKEFSPQDFDLLFDVELGLGSLGIFRLN